jgi:hypothetical protein
MDLGVASGLAFLDIDLYLPYIVNDFLLKKTLAIESLATRSYYTCFLDAFIFLAKVDSA